MITASPASSPQRCTKSFMDLPHELLDDIFGYLSWEEALSSSTLICKKVHAVIEKDYFWQKRLNAAIQLPINLQDLHQIEGIPRKRIFLAINKARFYTWGESTLGKLGHSYPITGSAVRSHRVPRGTAIPLEIRTLRDVFIVDIKTGGWSTHFLTFDRDVYSFGSMNGQSSSSSNDPVRMKFPDPIVQISAGRNHLVALSSKGEIYSYIDLKSVPQRIMFSEHVIAPSNPYSKNLKHRQVRKVVGGWNCSGALLHGVGIIIWRHEVKADMTQLHANFEGVKIMQSDNWVQESHVKPPEVEPLEESVDDPFRDAACQIVDFVILEDYLVLITANGKVYCVEMKDSLPSSDPILLEYFSAPDPEEGKIIDRAEAQKKKIDRISGFFQRFAVYNKHGLVHIGNSEILKHAVEDTRRAGSPDRNRQELKPLAMPNLKRFGTIVQIVFGDYHSHALTGDGTLLSWGVESQNCGCLGIGDYIESERRGVEWENGNGCLDEAAEVFFHDPPYPRSAYPERTAEGVVSWGDLTQRPTYGVSRGGQVGDVNDVRLDTRDFCVLSITAAGWHSGALVLPITDSLRTGAEPKKREGHEVFSAIHNGGYRSRDHAGEDEISQFDDSEHEPRDFDISNLRIPRTGHRGIRGISTVARGMRGGLRARGGRLHGSCVMRSGADESMRRSAFGAVSLEDEEEREDGADETSRDAESGLVRGRGGMRGVRGGHAPLGRQLGGETAEAGQRLGESIRMAVRGDKKGPTE